MSYTTRFTDEIRIDPPIPFEDIEGQGFSNAERHGQTKDVSLKVVEEPIPGEPGGYRRVAVAIVGLSGGFSCYDAIPDTQEIIDRWGEGRTFTGRLNASGEDAGDIWRLEIRDGRVVKVEPRIVWPDGSEGMG